MLKTLLQAVVGILLISWLVMDLAMATVPVIGWALVCVGLFIMYDAPGTMPGVLWRRVEGWLVVIGAYYVIYLTYPQPRPFFTAMDWILGVVTVWLLVRSPKKED